MENKLNIRVGDVVRLIPLTVTELYDDGDMCFKEDVGLISPGLVESVIAHAETDAEKIARLEARIAELEKSKQTLTSNGWDVSDLQVKFAYLDQVKGYGPWIKAHHLPPESNLHRIKAYYENDMLVAYCFELSDAS